MKNACLKMGNMSYGPPSPQRVFCLLGVPLLAKSLAWTQSPLFVQESPNSHCFSGSLNAYHQPTYCGQSALDPEFLKIRIIDMTITTPLDLNQIPTELCTKLIWTNSIMLNRSYFLQFLPKTLLTLPSTQSICDGIKRRKW